jgi:hypothetical protein
MSQVPPLYSVNEVKKPPEHRVHHDNDQCTPRRAIPPNERVNGTGGYRLCNDCQELDRQRR